jgi:U5 small nuclear ribonucleoprotein component
LSEDTETLKETLAKLRIALKPAAYKMDVRPLLKVVLDAFFGPSKGLVDLIVENFPSPLEASRQKVEFNYTGPQDSEVALAMLTCDASGPAVVHVAKLYHTADAQEFRAFGRVMSGTIRQGQVVKVLGEGYSPEDEEDMTMQTIDNIWVNESRLVMPDCRSQSVLFKAEDPLPRQIRCWDGSRVGR